MALEKIRNILTLLDLDFLSNEKLDGQLHLGDVDGSDDDFTGRLTDVRRRSSHVSRFCTGDDYSETFSATQCSQFDGKRYLRNYVVESREQSLFAGLLFGILVLGTEDEFLQFFKLDLGPLCDLEDAYYLAAAGAALNFGDGDEILEMQSTDSGTLNLSTCSHAVTCLVSRDMFDTVCMAMADLNLLLYQEIKSNSNFQVFDVRFEHCMILCQFNHTVSRFVHRVSGLSCMATGLKPILDASDPIPFIALNQRSFQEWPYPYQDLSLLKAVKDKWRRCLCDDACSRPQCISKRIKIALFGPSSQFRHLRRWIRQQCAAVFCVSPDNVEFIKVQNVLFQPLAMGTHALVDTVLEPYVEDDVDDGVETGLFQLTSVCLGRLRWSLNHYLSYYRSKNLCLLERLLIMHVDRQRSLESSFGDSFIEECVIHPQYYRIFSPRFYGSGFPIYMLRLLKQLVCYVSCPVGHPYNSVSACSQFINDMIKGPLGPSISGRWLEFLQNQLIPVLTSENAVVVVAGLLEDNDNGRSGDEVDKGEICAACSMQHVLMHHI